MCLPVLHISLASLFLFIFLTLELNESLQLLCNTSKNKTKQGYSCSGRLSVGVIAAVSS